MNIYFDFEAIKNLALYYAKEHKVNYNIILRNPVDGKFGVGSTYEFVLDSYFDKERPNVVILHRTDDILKCEEGEYGDEHKRFLLRDHHLPIISTPVNDVRHATYRRTSAKVGRNDLCVCGSGKKYKKCCIV